MTPSEQLSGWGGAMRRSSQVLVPPVAAPARVLDDVPPRGAIARGLGRSYGDAAQCTGGAVLDMVAKVGDSIRIDADSGTATVRAGVSLDQLMRTGLPRGWFVPVTPGTRQVTVGGAIAADIHGKNHHADGSFGMHVRRMSMLLADGSVVDTSPTELPELFWATVGGMGLTGVILDATIGLLPVESSHCAVDTDRAGGLDELMALMADGDDAYRYSVAWIDLRSRGAALGRGVLTRGDHASAEHVVASGVSPENVPSFSSRELFSLPKIRLPRSVVTPLGVRVIDEAWFRKAPTRRRGEVQTIGSFFHPLDAIGSWNMAYGRRGFVQYQFVVPFDADDTLRDVIETVSATKAASFLAVLKRFGHSSPAPLSFPTAGWTLTIDLPVELLGDGALLHSLDDKVLTAGGRHYLAKDAHMTPDAVRRGYPRLAEWQETRDRYDPDRRWSSDLARRLRLHGGHVKEGT